MLELGFRVQGLGNCLGWGLGRAGVEQQCQVGPLYLGSWLLPCGYSERWSLECSLVPSLPSTASA